MKYIVNIEYIGQQTIYGLWQNSNDRTISKDINALSKQYYATVSMPEETVLPYFVLSRNYNEQSRDFKLFVGSVIDKSGLEGYILSAGEYAKITVSPNWDFCGVFLLERQNNISIKMVAQRSF